MNKFPEISIFGGPTDRGRQHGDQLRERIASAINFYQAIFDMPEAEVFSHADYFAGLINLFSPDYCEEIEGIAEGANVDSRWIYALNARTEILSHKSPKVHNECTAIYFSDTSTLGQNWDWGKALEPLTVVMTIERPDGLEIKMVTEPGIIGKIGLNNRGVGVCLNILSAGMALNGLPVHVLLRAALDSASFDDAVHVISENARGKSSNILLGDSQGQTVDFEFCVDKTYQLQPSNGVLLHTNHYLGEQRDSPDKPDFFSSYARYEKAQELIGAAKNKSLDAMCEILSDDSNAELPIYRSYVPESMVQEVGTVCTVVMDLPARELLVRKGKHPDSKFFVYAVN